ncbi:signal peptidase I [Streptomyces bambusae]|uniref:signal peptidase I n=1 Tax=Streptomyces bambusae TaxID=1550616 RepID=UPI001CFFC356|nr:signal peptidase I [Streptomyces bambusae]MCB5169870.1 signal peptidase I [Streptomyces bambusae]
MGGTGGTGGAGGRGTRGSGNGHGRLGNVLSGLVVAVGFLLFVGGMVWGAVEYRPYTVPTDSMVPTVKPGDRVLAQRIDGSEVRRGDVVIFTDAVWSNAPMVKRVVGIGGDVVSCCGKGGRLTVNGKALDEPYLGLFAGKASDTPFEVTVPEGNLFLLGDQRGASLDSRSHIAEAGQGTVPRSAVSARVDAVAWSDPAMLERPTAFAGLPGGISSPGPLRIQLYTVTGGAVLVLAGAAYGPLARLAGRGRRGSGGGAGGTGAGAGGAGRERASVG